MKRWIPTPEAYQLLHEGQIALSEIESNGIRIDKEYLDRALDDTAVQIKRLQDAIRADPNYRKWHNRYGDKTNVASPEQMAGVVFGELGYKSKVKTSSGKRDSASEKALEGIDIPLVKNYLEMQHTIKGRDTFLVGIARETVRHADGDWWAHPVYNLNTVASFRSSASDFNIQNQPTRNPTLAEMVRRSLVPRRGFQFVENDFAQQEVRVSACYNRDPNLMAYIFDPTTDMHRDVGEQIFMLDRGQLSKPARHVAKNQFTFPTFYGSYYAQMVPDIWDSMASMNLKVNGTDKSLRDHLADKGITERGVCDPDERPERGTFEYHVKEIEEHFWGTRFAVYAQWKKDWVAAYRRDGGCRFLTGFVMTGPHAKNDIINYPIQGSSFHCLLWALVRIVNHLRRYKMRSRVVAQIHDCVIGDVHPDERDDYIETVRYYMTDAIKKWAPWLIVPLSAEVEVCPVDGSWFEKKAWVERGGKWVPPEDKK